MRFAFSLSAKNILRKPARAFLLALLVALLSCALLVGAFTSFSLKQGLNSYSARLGADIVVVPVSAASHGTVDQVLLEGISGNYYMDKSRYDKIAATEGVGPITRQFFLTSAKASCCSTRVQIIGFDPETDFVITPWISQSYSGAIEDGCAVAGANINVPEDGILTFYGEGYRVVGQLEQTGTGLDSAVYVNINTMKAMARSAARLLETSPFQGVDIDSASSAVFIRVAEGYDISDVTDRINIKISKVEATPARSMVSGIAAGLGRVTGVIGGLIAAVWALTVVILMVAFALVSHERRREYAVLRATGASRALLSAITAAEALMISAAGGIIGLSIGALVISQLDGLIQGMLKLPYLRLDAVSVAAISLGALILSIAAGLIASFVSAMRLTRGETGLLLREGA